MQFPETHLQSIRTLSLEAFREMDYYAVNNYHLPIELMMENAGLQLARLTASLVSPGAKVLVAAGPGNNGGGGLVAARRLEAWGYPVHIQVPLDPVKRIVRDQLNRTVAYGAEWVMEAQYDVVLDCLFGFSQRLPLPAEINEMVERLNYMKAMKISLDIPTGISETDKGICFRADKVVTVAAPKTILFQGPQPLEVFVADVGIPVEVYTRNKIDVAALGFHRDQLVRIIPSTP